MKKNKGFSLIELIVVILIIAIVAVALAPQVVKWVQNSRIAADLDMRGNIENACVLALANEDAFDRVKDGGYEIIITKSASTGTISHQYVVSRQGSEGKTTQTLDKDDVSALHDAFWDRFLEVGGYSSFDNFEDVAIIKSATEGKDITLRVHVYEGGYTFSELDGVNKDALGISDVRIASGDNADEGTNPGSDTGDD